MKLDQTAETNGTIVPVEATKTEGRGNSSRVTFPAVFWLVVVVVAAGAAVAWMVNWSEAVSLFLLLVLVIPIGVLSRALPEYRDAKWLGNTLMLAWVAKLLASSARYWALQVLYSGVGDASGYHGAGRRLAPIWRSIVMPPIQVGTIFVDAVTGLLYVPYEPTKLGGFFIFATLAFFGQVLFYAAFRRAFPSARLKWYAVLVFFFPNVLFWPSSIGKDSLMVLFIGTAAYAASRLLGEYRVRWLVLFGVAVGGSAMIRSHIALALVLSLLVSILLSRSVSASLSIGKVLSIFGIVVTLVFVAQAVVRDFGIDPSARINEALVGEVINPIFTGVEGQTDRGGSAVQGTAIRSLADIPSAVLRVLFRPLPLEAHNTQALANSLVEGSLLLAIFIWRGPTILGNFPRLWRHPYLLFSLVYTGGFIYGHSAILNLGILARQRSQVIPLVLVVLVALGMKNPVEVDLVVQNEETIS